MREELIKLAKDNYDWNDLRDCNMFNEYSFIDALLEDFLVLRKSEVRVIEMDKKGTFDCSCMNQECKSDCENCKISQVIVISKEK